MLDIKDHISNRSSHDTLVHYHLPKCAGSSINDCFIKYYVHHHGCRFVHPEHGIDKYEKMGQYATASDRPHYLARSDDRINFVAGHESFYSFAWEGVVNPTYFSFFRQPIDRIVSHFYWMKKSDKDLPDYDINQLFGSEDFWQEYVFDKTHPVNKYSNFHSCFSNYYTRALSKYSHFKFESAEPSEIMMNQAIDNIHNQVLPVMNRQGQEGVVPYLVFLFDKLDEGINVINKVFNIAQHINKHTNKQSYNKKLSTQSIDMMTKYNILDMRLYESVVNHYPQQLEVIL